MSVRISIRLTLISADNCIFCCLGLAGMRLNASHLCMSNDLIVFGHLRELVQVSDGICVVRSEWYIHIKENQAYLCQKVRRQLLRIQDIHKNCICIMMSQHSRIDYKSGDTFHIGTYRSIASTKH